MTTTTLIESRTNRLGIEVRTGAGERGATLRAYRLGELVAERDVTKIDGLQLGPSVRFMADLSKDTRDAVVRALDEGVRVLRDARGLGEAA